MAIKPRLPLKLVASLGDVVAGMQPGLGIRGVGSGYVQLKSWMPHDLSSMLLRYRIHGAPRKQRRASCSCVSSKSIRSRLVGPVFVRPATSMQPAADRSSHVCRMLGRLHSRDRSTAFAHTNPKCKHSDHVAGCGACAGC